MPIETILAILHKLVTLTVQGKITWVSIMSGYEGIIEAHPEYRIRFYPDTGRVFCGLPSMSMGTIGETGFDITLNNEHTKQLLSTIPQLPEAPRENSWKFFNNVITKQFLEI